jgi:hypothetical protein
VAKVKIGSSFSPMLRLHFALRARVRGRVPGSPSGVAGAGGAPLSVTDMVEHARRLAGAGPQQQPKRPPRSPVAATPPHVAVDVPATLSAKHNPFLHLAALPVRAATQPPKPLVDGIMSILKGRDLVTISQHFRDMEASLDERWVAA